MKLLRQDFNRDSSGTVNLKPEDKEDLWSIYNLIQKGDCITIVTTRNIKFGTKGKSEKVTLTLTIKVENVDFVPSEENMRVSGKTTIPMDDVPLNSYHTAEIEVNKNFKLYKDEWDVVALDIVKKACSLAERAEVGAVVLEEGVAHLCLISDNITFMTNKVTKSIPRKRRGDASSHDKAMVKFYRETAESVFRHFDILKLKAIILASPGFVAKGLHDTLMQLAVEKGLKDVIKNKSKFIITHSSTGYLQGLEEALKEDHLKKELIDTKFQKEVILLDDFFRALDRDDGRAWYGLKETEKAIDLGAVKTLLITDTLFRSDDIAKRKHYIALATKVRQIGGEIIQFSSLHESGVQLDQLTGIAVILSYPVDDLDEDDEE